MDDVAIRIDHVSKNFKLPHEKTSSVKNLFVHAYRYIKKRRTFETQQALHDISFEIKKGEFFGIVGRNGSGKSTLLKMLAGIYKPTSGTLNVSGKLVPFIELGVGFNPELTGRENVYLNGALLGFSKKQIDVMYQEIVEFAELKKFMDQKLKNYSSGMQVRLAFSMAIKAEADILLVDEVLAVGDADFQRKCFDYFRELKRNKKTVVFVSHDMSAVREYCDRAILIEASKLVDEGLAPKIATEYTRLFTDKELNVSSLKNGKQKRWGNNEIKIKSSKVSLSTDEKKLTVQVELLTDLATAASPVLGFLINGPSGVSIVGTNTKILQRPLPTLRKGRVTTCKFEIDNIFNDGVHTIDLAVLNNDAITVCDWWENALTFRINRENSSPYLISPDVRVKV